jgi:hypothetical protein
MISRRRIGLMASIRQTTGSRRKKLFQKLTFGSGYKKAVLT